MEIRTFKPKSTIAILNRVPYRCMCYACIHKNECIHNDGRRVDDCSDFIFKEINNEPNNKR